MYVLLLLVVDAVIFMFLRELNGPLALLFLILALVSVPALILHRREARTALECGPESESTARGWVRLAGNLGLDLTGVALAALIIIAFALALRSLSASNSHGHRSSTPSTGFTSAHRAGPFVRQATSPVRLRGSYRVRGG